MAGYILDWQMNIDALKEEIAKPEYTGMSDQEIAAAINAKTVTRSRLVETWEVKKKAIEDGYWALIVIGSEASNQVLQVRGLCISALAWLDDPKIATIDFTLQSTQMMVGGLVQSGIATQEQAEALLALGTETVSFASTLGAPKIGSHHVEEARNGK